MSLHSCPTDSSIQNVKINFIILKLPFLLYFVLGNGSNTHPATQARSIKFYLKLSLLQGPLIQLIDGSYECLYVFILVLTLMIDVIVHSHLDY